MARFNQSGGRGNEAWRARYAAREQRAAEICDALRARGYDAQPAVVTAGGPGVPGGIKYLGAVTIDGRRISTAKIREILGS